MEVYGLVGFGGLSVIFLLFVYIEVDEGEGCDYGFG